ncbi:hypothetical protein CVT26_011035 [Gymnopilus dilepis]|uniref:Uncharacterized protein n=1 Tax=Gymnopilus dilepis TaxID=231916 RepID=A0A409VY26_9AGAR|nr:hypothetical protein CVT26_011035 [Gymnopilus dilepis]
MPRTPYGAEYQGPPQPSTTPAASAPYNKCDSKHVHRSQDLEYETLRTASQFPSSVQGGQQSPGFNSGTRAKHFPGFSENIGGSSYTGNAEYQWPPQPSVATPASTLYSPPFHFLVIDNSVRTSKVGSGNSYTSLVQDSYNDNSNMYYQFTHICPPGFCGTCKRTFEPFNATEVDTDNFDESPSSIFQFGYESRFPVPPTGTQRAPAAEHHHVNHLVRYFQSETATKSYFAHSGNSGDIGGASSPAAWYPPSYPVYYTTDGNLLGGQPIYLVPRDSDASKPLQLNLVRPNTKASPSRKAKKGIKSLWKFLSSKI